MTQSHITPTTHQDHPAFTIPVGTTHTPEPTAPVRTPAQRATVKTIVEDDFAFACGNPLTAEVPATYTGPFYFTWYSTSGTLHCARIAKNGRILRAWAAKNGDVTPVNLS